MKWPTPLFITLIFLGSAHAQVKNEMAVKPFWSFSNYELGGFVGFSSSHLNTTEEFHALLQPTGNRVHQTASTFGIQLQSLIKPWLLFSVGLEGVQYGQHTSVSSVAFMGNDFFHTLKSKTSLSYLSVPVKLGLGYSGIHHRLFLQGGFYGAVLESSDFSWTVDGENYLEKPDPLFLDRHLGWIGGLEYGMKVGKGWVLVNWENRLSQQNIATGVTGKAQIVAQSFRLGYSYVFNR